MEAWDTSCLDWKERLMTGASLVPDLPLFREEMEKALRVFKRLRLPDVIGKPTMADACGPWFFAIVAAAFGSLDIETNRRMIQEIFLMIPKKNSKSTNAAAMGVTALIMNRRPNSPMAVIAPTIEVASISFRQAKNTIKSDPALEKVFHIQDHLRQITNMTTDSTLKIKAADTDTVTGSLDMFTLIDETHVFAKHSRAADVFLEIRGALTARPDGLIMQITTQSKEPPTGVFKDELAMARDVRDGKIRLPLLPVLYELPEQVQKSKEQLWKEKRFWSLVNPNLGRSVDETYLVNELAKAERKGPAQLALFASQHFNIEIGVGLSTDAWEGATSWEGAEDASITLDSLLERSEVVVVSVDGGGLDDLLGLCVLGRERDTRRWLSWSKAWCHPKILGARPEIAPKLNELISLGQLEVDAHPEEAVADLIIRIDDEGLLPMKGAVGVDSVGITDVIDALERKEFDTTQDTGRIVGISQGYKLNGAILTAGKRVANGELVHAKQELMNWAVGNAKTEMKGNAVTITKQVAGRAKIDPLIALFGGVVLLSMNPEPAGRVGLFAM